MNALLFFAIALLPAAAVLLTRMIFCRYPWQLCTSVADWLLLPFYGVYILIILTVGWLIRYDELWNPGPTRDAASHRLPACSRSPRTTTSPT